MKEEILTIDGVKYIRHYLENQPLDEDGNPIPMILNEYGQLFVDTIDLYPTTHEYRVMEAE